MKRLITTTLVMAFAVLSLHATTISPFKNLGEMAKHTSVVVMAKAIENYEVEVGETTRFRTKLSIESSIKGGLEIGEEISVQNMQMKIGDLERIVFGDIELQEGSVYLLFLEARDDHYLAKMLSYGVLQEVERNDEKLLMPVGMGQNFHIEKNISGEKVEKLGIYNKRQLKTELLKVVDNRDEWSSKRVLSQYNLSDFSSYRTPPSNCTYLYNAPYTRWEDAEISAIPVYYHEDLDATCSNTASQMSSAIANVSGYSGLSLSNSGTHNFVPTCANGDGATGSEFTSYVSSTFGYRSIVVQFDDPCNEIPDLSSCNGVLALGGLYSFGSTYTYLGETYRIAAYGSVFVNNGVGACQCSSTDYEIMMTHELTHALNIGHIDTIPPSPDSPPNMYPSCCNDISSIDHTCVDFIYPLTAMPIQLGDFTGEDLDGQVLLSWNSLSETNNDYYTIEKMQADGSFKNIGTVQGVGNTTEEQLYEFVDLSSVGGVNTYRLSQTDYDGHMRVLKAIQVDVSSSSDLAVYPNPLNGSNLNIRFSAERKTNYHVEILDIVGKTVYSENLVLGKGNHVETVEMNEVSGNLFFVKVTEGSTTKVIKVIR